MPKKKKTLENSGLVPQSPKVLLTCILPSRRFPPYSLRKSVPPLTSSRCPGAISDPFLDLGTVEVVERSNRTQASNAAALCKKLFLIDLKAVQARAAYQRFPRGGRVRTLTSRTRNSHTTLERGSGADPIAPEVGRPRPSVTLAFPLRPAILDERVKRIVRMVESG